MQCQRWDSKNIRQDSGHIIFKGWRSRLPWHQHICGRKHNHLILHGQRVQGSMITLWIFFMLTSQTFGKGVWGKQKGHACSCQAWDTSMPFYSVLLFAVEPVFRLQAIFPHPTLHPLPLARLGQKLLFCLVWFPW